MIKIKKLSSIKGGKKVMTVKTTNKPT